MRQLALSVAGLAIGFALSHYVFRGDERFIYFVLGVGVGFAGCAVIVLWPMRRRG